MRGSQGWQVEFVSASPSDLGGYKEVVVRISDLGWPIPAQIRKRADMRSACSGNRVSGTRPYVRMYKSRLPEADEIGDVVIDPSDLRN